MRFIGMWPLNQTFIATIRSVLVIQCCGAVFELLINYILRQEIVAHCPD